MSVIVAQHKVSIFVKLQLNLVISNSDASFPFEFEDTKGVIRIRKSKKSDNTMAKIKRTKGKTTIYKTLYRKLKIRQRNCLKSGDELRCSGSVSRSFSTSDTLRVTLVTHL